MVFNVWRCLIGYDCKHIWVVLIQSLSYCSQSLHWIISLNLYYSMVSEFSHIATLVGLLYTCWSVSQLWMNHLPVGLAKSSRRSKAGFQVPQGQKCLLWVFFITVEPWKVENCYCFRCWCSIYSSTISCNFFLFLFFLFLPFAFIFLVSSKLGFIISSNVLKSSRDYELNNVLTCNWGYFLLYFLVM